MHKLIKNEIGKNNAQKKKVKSKVDGYKNDVCET